MAEKKISDLFHIKARFLRSVHLERDFRDPSALSNYVVTDFVRSCVERMAHGLKPHSGQRAWRLTGNYGSGKSSFALLLAHWFASQESKFPPQIRSAVNSQQLGVALPHYLPVLVTCSRQALGASILKSLHWALSQLYGRGAKSKLLLDVQRLLDAEPAPTDDQVFQLILKVNTCLIAESKSKGLLLILDELGKFLEFAALYPQRHDVFLLQQLAEAAARSGDEPLFILGLLHQGFAAYTDHLDQSAQREWEKVAGRFEEIVFDQPIEQVAMVVASALDVSTSEIPRTKSVELKQTMETTLALGWFGAAQRKILGESAASLYPLHPTVLPVLIRTFRRFGQNERSLFSFLLSHEPCGLQAFSEKDVRTGDLYRLHDFYDYVRVNFGHRLAAQSYRNHWNVIDAAVETFATEDELELNILKTVGVLNLLNDGDLLPTEDSLICAIANVDQAKQKRVREAVEKLRQGKRILYDRGRARGLCVWPHTSVDLEKAYEEACRATDTPQRIATFIMDSLETRPVVARRHYIETGNLRYSEVKYCSVMELPELLDNKTTDADGLIIIPLCETAGEREEALKVAKRLDLKAQPNLLIAVPQPLNSLASFVQEVQRWEWVATNVLELQADKYAREEVFRQKAITRSQLEKRLQSCIGWKQLNGPMLLEWFHKGRPLSVTSGRQLLEALSRIFDDIYSQAPYIKNELVNRRALSSAAAAARMRLIERMLTDMATPFLGMNVDKRPPEMSIYLSVLKQTGLHREDGLVWRIDEPSPEKDLCRVLPVFRRMGEIVQEKSDSRINVAMLFAELRKPPYGVRDGIIPLLFAVFAIANEKNIAFYKDGTFVREVDGETMRLLTKAPEKFDIQYCKIEGLRAELFGKLLAILEIKPLENRDIELIDVVKKLCVFVAQLPPYVLATKKLSPLAVATRTVILDAREPAKLLFVDLPRACSFDPIETTATISKSVQAFVKTLKNALDELRGAYPELQERMREQLRQAFHWSGPFQEFRTALAGRAEQVLLAVSEPKLRAFCLRLLDDNLPESEWLESLGSYLALKPPSRWHDAEEEIFNSELVQVAARFHRVESITFGGGKSPKNGTGVRLAITQANGIEHEQVVHFTMEDEPSMRELQAQFEMLLANNKRLGLAAASRAIWANLEKERRP
jgi:hypothetical protein